MNCQEARDSLSMLLDGDIGLTERVPLELHVNSCEGCQRRLAHLQELRELEQRPRPAPRPIHWRPIHWRLIHWHPIHWRPVHWRPILAPGFVEKALGVMRAEDLTTRLRRLAAEKIPCRQLAVAAAIPLLIMLAVFVFERGFTVGSTMRQRPAAPSESRSDTPVAPSVISIAPSPPAVIKPVVPDPVPPPPAAVTQLVPPSPAGVTRPASSPPAAVTTPALPSPSVATQPATTKPTSSVEKGRGVGTQVAAARVPEAAAIDTKGASTAARSDSVAKDEKPSAPAVTKPAPAKDLTATNGSSEANRKVAAVKPATDAHAPIKASETQTVASSRRGMVDVVGRLQVKRRSDAERYVAALFARARSTGLSRQHGPSVTVLEGGIPQANYATFARGITRIGSWRLEAERSPLPEIVQVSVRVAE